MGIQVNVGVGLLANSSGRAIVASVSYDPCDYSTIGQEEIHMETTDGQTCKWSISSYNRVRLEDFYQTKEDILSGKIKPGTEVNIIYNPNGILAFGL